MQPSPVEPTLPPGLPDEWVMDRDVSCPACGYNLRMRREPRCPECGAVHRWQALLLVACPRCGESLSGTDAGACPRCGVELNWRVLLDGADPLQHGLFEYARAPWRAGFKLFAAVLRPRRFWDGVPLEAPVQTKRLRRLSAALLLLFLLAGAAFGAGVLPWILPYLISNFAEIWRYRSLHPGGLTLIIVTLLHLGPVVLLPLFSQTFARFRIRRDQLRRCSAYAAVALAWITPCLLLLGAVDVARAYRSVSPLFPEDALSYALLQDLLLPVRMLYQVDPLASLLRAPEQKIVLPVAIAVYVAVFLWQRMLYLGLRQYLRLDRFNALAIVGSTLVITVLACLTLAFVALYWRI